jgi:hypothetical protein
VRVESCPVTQITTHQQHSTVHFLPLFASRLQGFLRGSDFSIFFSPWERRRHVWVVLTPWPTHGLWAGRRELVRPVWNAKWIVPEGLKREECNCRNCPRNTSPLNSVGERTEYLKRNKRWREWLTLNNKDENLGYLGPICTFCFYEFCWRFNPIVYTFLGTNSSC